MSRPIHIGIDPGKAGAVAVIYADDSVEFHDCPIADLGPRTDYADDLMAAILRRYPGAVVALERVNAMPSVAGQGDHGSRRSMGATSAFSFGVGFGIWRGVLAALGMRRTLIAPARWKKLMLADMPKDKDASRQRAMQLYPKAVDGLKRKKDHGRADALLIATAVMRLTENTASVEGPTHA